VHVRLGGNGLLLPQDKVVGDSLPHPTRGLASYKLMSTIGVLTLPQFLQLYLTPSLVQVPRVYVAVLIKRCDVVSSVSDYPVPSASRARLKLHGSNPAPNPLARIWDFRGFSKLLRRRLTTQVHKTHTPFLPPPTPTTPQPPQRRYVGRETPRS
jgi:hypothetical protein